MPSTSIHSPRRIFISSTCYDLLDLRAEVKAMLEADGFLISMSDQPETFEHDGLVNSIETCLANLRASDLVLVILSQRYGPPLKPLGNHKSATHVEYDEAVKLGKPIYLFVRDRLMASFDAWSASKRTVLPSSPWSKDLEPLLGLIDEHQRLEPSKRSSNWFDLFSTSVDLRATLRARLGSVGGRLLLEKILREGRLGSLSLSMTVAEGSAKLWLTNNMRETAYNVQLVFPSGMKRFINDVQVGFGQWFDGADPGSHRMDVEWTSMQIGRLSDRFQVDSDGGCTLISRRLLTTSTVVLLGRDDPEPIF